MEKKFSIDSEVKGKNKLIESFEKTFRIFMSRLLSHAKIIGNKLFWNFYDDIIK